MPSHPGLQTLLWKVLCRYKVDQDQVFLLVTLIPHLSEMILFHVFVIKTVVLSCA